MKYVFISLPMNGRSDKDIGHRLCSINGAVKKACVEKLKDITTTPGSKQIEWG